MRLMKNVLTIAVVALVIFLAIKFVLPKLAPGLKL